MKYDVFRDDDISITTDISLLMRTHEIIVKHGRTHTVAVLMERLWENKEVWLWLMTTPHLSVGLHGWTHLDYSREPLARCRRDIYQSLQYWTEHVGAYPDAPQITTFYPPWNRVGPAIEEACRDTGLMLDARWKKGTPVYGFHSWEMLLPDRVADLERALKAKA